MLYFLLILSSMLIIFLVNVIAGFSESWHYILLAVIIYTVAVIIVDGISALIIRRLFPLKWFNVDKKKFCAGKKESRFYEKIKIKKWKDKVLELGVFTAFSKSKIDKPNDNEYLSKYIVEANYGVLIHIVGVFLGFITMLINFKMALNIALPVAIVNAILNLLPAFILRYNLPKLHTLYKYNQKKNRQN